ncbi:hypothetical protein [uncultured Hymenobacter sp.]|uniref:hypothetical protein n=1 Tax=uncultured Hymenobacter sp. TaxID=170016 RepID=UPI0035CB6DBB
MAILNYTTTIAAGKTTQEIQMLLAKAGAQKVLVDYETSGSGEPVAITFAVAVGPEQTLWWFTLPSNWQGVLKALTKAQVAWKYRTEAQARRVSWRIIKNWCEAQLAIIEAGQAGLAEVFLPYAQTPSGDTLYKAIESGSLKLLN